MRSKGEPNPLIHALMSNEFLIDVEVLSGVGAAATLPIVGERMSRESARDAVVYDFMIICRW